MEESQAALERMLCFTVGGAEYALPVANVVRILSLRRNAISSVPFDENGRVRGIFNYQGSIVAIARHKPLSADSDERGAEQLTAVILRDGEKRFAILVDKTKVVTAGEPGAGVQRLSAHGIFTGETDGR